MADNYKGGKLDIPAKDDTTTSHHQQQLSPANICKKRIPLFVFFKDARNVFKLDGLGREILRIAFPAALALAADPVASLIDTAFIGRLGSTELAAVGVAIAIFNQASKITIFPLVSITTSFVAEEETIGRVVNNVAPPATNHHDDDDDDGIIMMKKQQLDHIDFSLDNMEKATTLVHPHLSSSLEEEEEDEEEEEEEEEEEDAAPNINNTSGVDGSAAAAMMSKDDDDHEKKKKKKKKQKRHIPSASTAIFIGLVLGLLQTLFLVFSAKLLLAFMGVKSGSPMLKPALKYLTLRSFGAPAVLLSLAMQGVFRGFKDTTTPLYATVAGDLTNIILDPILIFVCRMGVSGAAIAHVLSQYLISLILLWKLMKQVDLLAPNIKDLQFNKFLKNGVLLLARVIAVTFCVTLAASMAARLGATPMAAFQVCLQVWMTSSLLADGLAVAGQAILASSFAEKDYRKATAAATRVLQMGFVLGLGLAILVGVGLRFGSGVFTDDINVKHIIFVAIPFVAATQPINSLAFVFDGVNFGASDFAYSAYSMVLVSIVSVASLFSLSKSSGFVGIWVALTIYMALRALAGFWRMGTGTGPWHFLRGSY